MLVFSTLTHNHPLVRLCSMSPPAEGHLTPHTHTLTQQQQRTEQQRQSETRSDALVTHSLGAALRPGASCSTLLRDGWRLDQFTFLPGEHLQGAFAVHPDFFEFHAQPPHPPADSPLVCSSARAQGEVGAIQADLQPRQLSVCLPPAAVAHRAAQAH